MAGIYSTQLGISADLNTDPIVYVVPDGQVAVVKDIDVAFYAADIQVYLELGYDTSSAYPVVSVSTGPRTFFQWSGGIVVTAGQTLTLAATVTGATGVVSGFLLSAPG